ncbi:MAG: hypothetical protein R3E53_04395 [Myxococcota bacterium]
MVGADLRAVAFIAAMAAVSGGTSWRTSALAVELGGFAIILPFALRFAVRRSAAEEGDRGRVGEADRQGEPAGAGDPGDRARSGRRVGGDAFARIGRARDRHPATCFLDPLLHALLLCARPAPACSTTSCSTSIDLGYSKTRRRGRSA